MQDIIKLSVIVPVFNTGKYLTICLDALLAQTLPQMEIIVIDDYSDEDISSIIKPYQKRAGDGLRFRRLDAHCGPGGARNAGTEMALGTFIAFCDSDDWVDITYYEDCVQAMEKQNASIAMCSLVRCYDYVQTIPLYKCQYDREISISGDIALKILTKQIDLGFLIIPSSVNKVYRRSFLENLKLRFQENTLFEDLLFSFVALMNAPKVLCIPNVTYHHYKRPNSIVQSFTQKHVDDFVKIFTLLRSYLKGVNRYEEYCFNYYKFMEQFYNLVVREIFEFVPGENDRKTYLAYSLGQVKTLIDYDEYIEYTTAEQLRRHIQPHITDTAIY